MPQFDVIGQSAPQIDAMQKATGRTRFVSDLSLPNMLYGAILRSPHAHARIRNIDVSRARALPGVREVVTFDDTPGIAFGPRSQDWYILAKDKALFYGHEVAAVAATDPDTAEEALELIRVEYEELPAVLDPVRALEPDAPRVYDDAPSNLATEFNIAAGDVDRALDESYFVFEDRFYTSQVYQAYLETKGAVADVDPAGRITL